MKAKRPAPKEKPTSRVIRRPPGFLTESAQESEASRRDRFQVCEQNISAAGKTFLAAALAMETIQRDKLYKVAGYEGFEEYLAKRWGISRPHGYRLVHAGRVIKEVEEVRARTKQALALPSNLAGCLELERSLPKDDTRGRQLTIILSRASKKAAAHVQETNGVAPPHGVEVVIDAEHIRAAVQETAGAADVRPPRSRDAACDAARRRVEGILTELRGVLDAEIDSDRELLQAAEDFLRRLAARGHKEPQKGG